MWGADGMVDMRDSKSRAARRSSSSLELPTRRKEWIFFLVRLLKFIPTGCRSIVVVCRRTPITVLKKVYRT